MLMKLLKLHNNLQLREHQSLPGNEITNNLKMGPLRPTEIPTQEMRP